MEKKKNNLETFYHFGIMIQAFLFVIFAIVVMA